MQADGLPAAHAGVSRGRMPACPPDAMTGRVCGKVVVLSVLLVVVETVVLLVLETVVVLGVVGDGGALGVGGDGVAVAVGGGSGGCSWC